MKFKIIFLLIVCSSFAFGSNLKRHDLSLRGDLSIVGNGNLFWASAPFCITTQTGDKIFSSSPFRRTSNGWAFIVDGKISKVEGFVVLSKANK